MTAIENTTVEKYGVARGDEVLELFDDVAQAYQQQHFIRDTMTSIGLEPDVQVVTVQVRTTYGKPKVHTYADPEPVVEETEEPADPEAPPTV